MLLWDLQDIFTRLHVEFCMWSKISTYLNSYNKEKKSDPLPPWRKKDAEHDSGQQ
jgi:hypothetical protein